MNKIHVLKISSVAFLIMSLITISYAATKEEVAQSLKEIELEEEHELKREQNRLKEENRLKKENGFSDEYELTEEDKLKIRVKNIAKAKPVRKNKKFLTFLFGNRKYNGQNKGEFETKSKFIKRINKNIDREKIYYFDIPVKTSKYNIENQHFYINNIDFRDINHYEDIRPDAKFEYIAPNLKKYLHNNSSYDSTKIIQITLENNDSKNNGYGSNAYGATTTVTSLKSNNLYLM